MERWYGRVALVVGASAGIGAAVSKLLCQNGMKVVACARRVEKIKNNFEQENTATKKLLFPYKCDLQNVEEIEKMFSWIEINPELGRIDVCIPVAGFSTKSSLLEGSVKEWHEMLNVNVIALNVCTQLTVKQMIKQNIDDGQILLMGSLSGHRVPPSPSTRFYAATKHAVKALLDGWRHEIHSLGLNIRIGQVSPGVVETEFSYVMNADKPELAKNLYASMDCLQAKDIAESMLQILSAPPHVQINDILVRPTRQLF